MQDREHIEQIEAAERDRCDVAGRCCAPDDVPQDAAGRPESPRPAVLLGDQREARSVQSWGPAPPSTIEVYIARCHTATNPPVLEREVAHEDRHVVSRDAERLEAVDDLTVEGALGVVQVR